MISTQMIQRVARRRCKLNGEPEYMWTKYEASVRDFLETSRAVHDLKHESEERSHQEAMDAAFGPHGQG